MDDHGLNINVERIALLYEDIEKYNLPPNFEKETDTRQKGYREMGYVKQAELDALPPDVLKKRVRDAIEAHLNMEQYQACQDAQKEKKMKLEKFLDQWSEFDAEI